MSPRGRSTLSLQAMLDSGLNGFGVELVAESINGHRQKEKLRKPFSFAYDDVCFTFSLMPEQEWTEEKLVGIFRPIADTETPESFLIRFARTYVLAEREERLWLVHVALMLIDKYELWPDVSPSNAAEDTTEAKSDV